MQLVKEKIPALLGHLAKTADLYVPVTTDGITEFVLWQGEGTPIDFTAVNSKLPPKDLLFPQAEDLYRYQVTGQQITELQEVITEKAQVLFGIRSCDMASIQCMDDVFLTKGYVDSFYQRRREGLLTIAIACAKVLPTCFCDSMGLNPQKATGADIQLLPTAVGYNVIAQTEKGQATVADWQDFLTDGEAETEQVSCELKVNMAGIPEKLAKMFHHPIWEKEGKKCLGCGTCTYLCPTCYCFDIDGETCGDQGTKFRCWDSCMFSEYTRMAGGHNPRPSKKERVRNRFLHKLCFFQQRYGKNLCTGCGRCVAYCPVHLDITCFIDKVGEVTLDD